MATTIGSDNPSSSSTSNKTLTVAPKNSHTFSSSKNQIDQTHMEKSTSSDLVPSDDPIMIRSLLSLVKFITFPLTFPFKWKKKKSASDAEWFSKLIDTDLNSIRNASERIANANYDSEIKKVSDELSKLKNEGASAEQFRKLMDTTKDLKQQISIRTEDHVAEDGGVSFDDEGISKLIETDLQSISKASERIAKYNSEITKLSNQLSELKINKDASAKQLRELMDETKHLKKQISIRPEDVPEDGVCCVDAEGISKLIAADLRSISEASKRIARHNFDSEIKVVSDELSELKKKGASAKQFRKLMDETKKLMGQISISSEDKTSAWKIVRSGFALTRNNGKRQGEMTSLQEYNKLKEELQKCLQCFSVFPKNAEIKKRVMIYWWIAVGLASETKVIHQQKYCCKASTTTIEKTAEQVANEFFNELVDKGFIESMRKKHTCKVRPSVQVMLSQIPEENKFFHLVEDESKKGKKIQVSFNLSQENLDLNPEWISTRKNVQVLYQGRWQNSNNAHVIEVEYSRFMKMKGDNVFKGLEKMKKLRFLSLQGISKFTNLPQTILKNKNLTILDLKGCPDLEVIPDGIGSLKNLTHLDMSECYLLDHMPKGLASLSKLQVLGGFVVVKDSKRGRKNMCTLDDLQKLKGLRKLSIHTDDNEFPKNADLRALNQFQALTKLTIAWGRGAAEQVTTAPKESHSNGCLLRFKSKKKLEKSNSESLPLPPKLKKLSLQCFPEKTAPSWLDAGHLKCLKKLYIRGGQLSDLFQEFERKEASTDKWEVEVLQLKYLNNLSIKWTDLHELFPKLNCLEMLDCPELTDFKCNKNNGVWKKENN